MRITDAILQQLFKVTNNSISNNFGGHGLSHTPPAATVYRWRVPGAETDTASVVNLPYCSLEAPNGCHPFGTLLLSWQSFSKSCSCERFVNSPARQFWSGGVRVRFRVRFQVVKVLIFGGFPLGNPTDKAIASFESLCPSTVCKGSKYGWGGCPSTVLLLT